MVGWSYQTFSLFDIKSMLTVKTEIDKISANSSLMCLGIVKVGVCFFCGKQILSRDIVPTRLWQQVCDLQQRALLTV